MESSNQFHESFRQGLLPGYVFATTFFIVTYMCYCVPTQLIKKRKKKNYKQTEAKQMRKLPHQELKKKKFKEKQKQARQINNLLPMELLEKRIEVDKVGRLAYRMSFTKLCSATDYFGIDNAIGVGMIGIMYKASLPNGWFLAVKRLYYSRLFNRQFELEIMILGRYRHRNIVPLLGFCIEEDGKERILVYQYMSNARLSDWMRDTTRLGWHVVIRIALGVARGLCCLHHSLRMVHLNISSECILLGKNFEPKISNFGGAIFMNHDLDGTNLCFKKDVYDFGTLLFELIRGKKFGQMSDFFSNSKGPFATYTYPTNLFDDTSGFYDFMNNSLDDRQFEDEVSALLRVACDCVHPFPDRRPTMLEVYSKMSNIWERDGDFEDSLTSNQFEIVSASISSDELVELECL